MTTGEERRGSFEIDLDQLAARESEQVEWKENVARPDDVVETLAAFANDLANLGGGYVVCGAAEGRDSNGFASMTRVGLTADRLRELEGIVLSGCAKRVSPSIAPLVRELPADTPGRRILVFVQPSTETAHSVRTANDGARHYVRVGRSTVEAKNGVLRELLVRKGVQQPWDRRACPGATVDDLDLLALRDALQRMRAFSAETGVEQFLSSTRQLSALVPPLCIREAVTNVLRPRNFAMLLFGREVQRFIPGAFSLFSIYPGVDRSDQHAERVELIGTVIDQARRLAELLDVQSYTAFDKADTQTPNAVKYPKRALYEAAGNALAHRDYQSSDPTRVTVFQDRIEVLSPGPLPLGVDADAFQAGHAAPHWRNQALAWFFNRLQIAQAEGQGIPTILRSMREEGCPPPTLAADGIKVVCVLPAHPRHALLAELRRVEQAVGVGQLGRAQALARDILARDATNARALQLFAEIQTALRDPGPVAEMIEGAGLPLERLPSAVLLQLGDALHSDPGERDRYRALSGKLLAAASKGRLEEREVRRIAVGLSRNHDDQAVLDLVDRYLSEHPENRDDASMLQLRGDAMLNLAKQCRHTIRAKNLPKTTRDRVWKQFDAYLAQAEGELRRAETASADTGLTTIIHRNLEFLQRLRREGQGRG